MSFTLGSLRTATWAAWLTFRRVYDDPGAVQGGAIYRERRGYYDLLWHYYTGSAFEDGTDWSGYKGAYQLYRRTRLVYSHVRRLVDFYAGTVYPGRLALDGKNLPDGVPLAIPLADDITPELRTALGQFWQWSNWQAGKGTYVRYGALCGNVLVEVVDDLIRANVTANVVWPGNDYDLDLDTTGNVKAYALQYLAVDDNGMRYLYRKEVDTDAYRFFRDGQPYDYGDGASYPNPYGFVPAIWAKHKDIGGDYGAPVIYGSLGKLDELNSLVSHTHDQVHKVISAPVVFWSQGKVTNIATGQKKRNPDSINDYIDGPAIDTDREALLFLQGPEHGKVESLAGQLPLGEVMAFVEKLIYELEQDHPELAMYRELRAMSQVTGPAAIRLMGEVASLVDEASGNYDLQMVKLCQMALAIGGWRLGRGDWPDPTRQQIKFAPFDLTSYARGDLDFDILARPLVPETEMERMAVERMRLAIEVDKKVALIDPAQVGQTLTQAAEQNVVRAVIPRGNQ